MFSIKAESSTATATAAPAPAKPAGSSLPSPLWLLPLAVACIALWLVLRRRNSPAAESLPLATSSTGPAKNLERSSSPVESPAASETTKKSSKTKGKSQPKANNGQSTAKPRATATVSQQVADQQTNAPVARHVPAPSGSAAIQETGVSVPPSEPVVTSVPTKAIFEPLRAIKQVATPENEPTAHEGSKQRDAKPAIAKPLVDSKPPGKTGQFVPQKRQTSDINNNSKRWSDVLDQVAPTTPAPVQPASLAPSVENAKTSQVSEMANESHEATASRTGLKGFVSKVRSSKTLTTGE